MQPEFDGIERRLDERNERLARLRPLKDNARRESDQESYLLDTVERNLEIAVQCCIGICHRITASMNAQKPVDYREAIRRMGELNVLPTNFARYLAPYAGLHNILAHECLTVDWNEVYGNLQKIDDLARFADRFQWWLQQSSSPHE